MKINKNKEKKNILFYCPFIERGGIRTTLIKYANFLTEKYNVKIFTETTSNFQLSKFNRPESTDILGFSKSGTIEWE